MTPPSRHGRVAPQVSEDPTVPVVLKAAALVLSYPDAELLDRLDLIEAAVAHTSAADQFSDLVRHLREVPAGGDGDPESRLARAQAYHVQEFDLSRKHALHLSYWTDGDTRRRGGALVEIQRIYRESESQVSLDGELPDYLPVVLEFAAADPAGGLALLQRYRASLELIRLGLEADDLPHAGVLRAICACLPGESPRTRAEVQARFGEVQPVEFVGLSESARG